MMRFLRGYKYKMIPIIMSNEFVELGEFDDYISFIWTTRYYTPGDFELCLAVTPKSVAFIKKGYYVIRRDRAEAGIIENITIQRDEDLKVMMIVSGRFVSSIIGRRIISIQTQVSGLVTECVRRLIAENAINPILPRRALPGLSFSTTIDDGVTMQAQYTGKNLLETITKICETFGYGFRMIIDAESQRFTFQLFSGVDRSSSQYEYPQVIFSDTYDNLLSSEYEENYTGIVTDVLVAGEGEGRLRRTAWAYNELNGGLDRYELYKDARNISSNEGEIPLADYIEQLRVEGLESITGITKAFSGEVYFGNIVYGEDVNIGDICTIENSRWGLSINSRLVEVIESTSETGEYTVTPTFGI